MAKTSTIVAIPRLIDTSRAFYRHLFVDETLVSMLTDVIRKERWDLPPPLVVRCEREGYEFYWVLDGHHRIHSASILASNKMGTGQIWGYSVEEGEYNKLIKSRFGGEEPLSIGKVREHILTELGNANLADENWNSIRNAFKKGTYVHRPLFLYESHGNELRNIGHVNLRTDERGKIGIRTPAEFQNLFSMYKFSSKEKKIKKPINLEVSGYDGKEFGVGLNFKLDGKNGLLKVNPKTKGIVISQSWLGNSAPSSAAPQEVVFYRDTFYTKAILLYMAWTLKGKFQNRQRPIFRKRPKDIAPRHILEIASKVQVDDFLFAGLREVVGMQRREGRKYRRTRIS